MKIKRDAVLELRKGGDLSGKEVFGLLRQSSVKQVEEPATVEPPAPPVIPVLERLAVAVERLEQSSPAAVEAPEPDELLSPLLLDIKQQLQELNAATKKAELFRNKVWQFVPEYGHTGRIIKITVQ